MSAIAFADTVNLPFKVIKQALEGFTGVKRRGEMIGRINGVKAYGDYAHHPTEILNAIKCFDKNALVVFQPHTYSRTKYLLQDFVNVLKPLPKLIIYKTYPARESFDGEGSAKRLCKEVQNAGVGICLYAHTKTALRRLIKKQISGCDSVVFIGAGDIYDLAKTFLD